MRAARYRRGDRHRRRFWLIRGAVRRLTAALFAAIDMAVPKRRRRMVLSADKGLKYSGNPRQLFEWMVADGTWDAYWLTESPALLDELGARFPGRVVPAWSLRALWLGLTARWLGVSHSRYDLGPFAYLLRPRFLYLQHGAPLKTMGYLKAYYDPGVTSVARSFGAITCCSPFEAELWQRAYRLPRERMWVTGVARNDRLFAAPIVALQEVPRGRKIVLFAPTYRESGVMAEYLPVPGMNGDQLIALLERHDATMLVRPHYYEWEAAAATVARYGSDRLVSADERRIAEVNDLLPLVDVLVTDYSSLYIDFLLLDRPIVFSCHDVERYARERGFMIDYDTHTPGAKVRTPGQFLDALDRELAGADPFRDERARLRRLFHSHGNGGASRRIADRIAAG
ncbi:MAG TPA: CDP-glycerol glycerophosphotransferase family protein [Sphingomonas sp.]|nr:CDP-glycerol glycerophosphotransferase family protein [Sphingomonas sp.]